MFCGAEIDQIDPRSIWEPCAVFLLSSEPWGFGEMFAGCEKFGGPFLRHKHANRPPLDHSGLAETSGLLLLKDVKSS